MLKQDTIEAEDRCSLNQKLVCDGFNLRAHIEKSRLCIVGILLVVCSITMSVLTSHLNLWEPEEDDDEFFMHIKKCAKGVPRVINIIGCTIWGIAVRYNK